MIDLLNFLLVLLGMIVLGYIIIRFFPFIGWLFYGISFVAVILFLIAGLFILAIPVVIAVLFIVLVSKFLKGLMRG